MQIKSHITIFAGPSLNTNSRKLIDQLGIELRPPIKRGDIPDLLEAGFKGTLAICDGLFQQELALGHAEIREAMEAGIEVIGMCSLGAIRAYEMRQVGMKGRGKVYDWFFAMEDFQDDELALLHHAAPDYIPISEPMVHFREAIAYLEKTGKIAPEIAILLIDKLKKRFFGERTLDLYTALLARHTQLDPDETCKQIIHHRIKQQDLQEYLLDVAKRSRVLL